MISHPYHRPVRNCYVGGLRAPKGVNSLDYLCRETRCTTNLGCEIPMDDPSVALEYVTRVAHFKFPAFLLDRSNATLLTFNFGFTLE